MRKRRRREERIGKKREEGRNCEVWKEGEERKES